MAEGLENLGGDEYEPGSNFYDDGADDFDGLYANIPTSTLPNFNNNNPPPPPAVPTQEIQPLSQLMTREEEDRKIKEIIRRSEMDWQRYLRTGFQGHEGRGRGRGRGRGVAYIEAERIYKKPPVGYVCHRCGEPEQHYIYDCPTNGDPAFDNYKFNTWERERIGVPPKKTFVSQPDEKAFERAIKGIPTLPSSPEVKAEAQSSVKPPSTATVVAPANSVQVASVQSGRKSEETKQQSGTAHETGTSVSAGSAQMGFIRPKPYPGYVCHRCLKPDDHYIKDCPTNGDPAYDFYNRHRAKRVPVTPSVPHVNHGAASSVFPNTLPVYNQTGPFQGYPNPAQVFRPVQLNSFPGMQVRENSAQGFRPVQLNSFPGMQVRGNSSINRNNYIWRRTEHSGKTLPPNQSQKANTQVQRPNQQVQQVPPGNQNMGAPPAYGREGVHQHESHTKQYKRNHDGDVNNP